MEPAPLWAWTLMQDVAEGLTGDPNARCVLISETRQGWLNIASTSADNDEIRGLMFRAARELPTD